MSRQNQRFAARLRKLDTILGQLPDSQYNHDKYIDTSDASSCNTIGCAIGHATASGQFKGLNIRYNGPGLSDKETYTFGPIDGVPVSETSYDHHFHHAGFRQWANHYFGPGTYARIFDTSPYHVRNDWEDLTGGKVKAQVQDNIRQMAAEFEAV